MTTVKKPHLAMPKPEYWDKSQSLLSSLEGKLFASKQVLESEAKQHYDKFYELIKNNKLSIETISRFEQRILASMLFPSAGGEGNYLIKLEKCWSQMQRIILNRYDTQTIEILCEKASDCNAMLVPNFSNVIANLESTLVFSDSIRLQKTRRLLKIEIDIDMQSMSWSDSIKHRYSQKQLAIFKVFERFSKAEYSGEITDKALFFSRNNFWMYYFKNGLVKQSTLLVTRENSVRATAYTNNITEISKQQSHGVGIMFHIGNMVFIEWANPGAYHSIEESENIFPDFSLKKLDAQIIEKSALTRHRANAYCYWQYRAALSLRTSVGIQPSRSDYQIKQS